MKAVVQIVTSAILSVDHVKKCEIGKGLFILLGVTKEDTEADARVLVEKILRLRIFDDENGKINLSMLDPYICGDALIVSNFTLCANTAASRRPDFFAAASPGEAEVLYDYFVSYFKEKAKSILAEEYQTDRPVKVETGKFGGYMQIAANNDGPITICMDTNDYKKKV